MYKNSEPLHLTNSPLAVHSN